MKSIASTVHLGALGGLGLIFFFLWFLLLKEYNASASNDHGKNGGVCDGNANIIHIVTDNQSAWNNEFYRSIYKVEWKFQWDPSNLRVAIVQ